MLITNYVYQTADGETEPTIVVGRRVNTWRIEIEVVSISWGRRRVDSSTAWPTEAMVAEAPQSAIIKVNPPATDEVKRIASIF